MVFKRGLEVKKTAPAAKTDSVIKTMMVKNFKRYGNPNKYSTKGVLKFSFSAHHTAVKSTLQVGPYL